uniref:Guanylate cyclase domain-containing protein n=1 Tax=Ditylum brightwellii TaxID=49249 RepID=A0A7S1ZC46_9STRA
MAMKEVDALSRLDIVLIKDIATSLGIHLRSKRLQKVEAESHQMAKEFLHSLIPPSIISKIEHNWIKDSSKSIPTALNNAKDRDIILSNSEDSKEEVATARIEQIRRINRQNSSDLLTCAVTTEVPMNMENPQSDVYSSPVLYAEEKHNVSIVFVDIVGFSRIAAGVTPLKVMDMLQNLFSRFDLLCEKHGVQKLDTVGDAYIACALDDDDDENNREDDNGKSRALCCLNLAKDMVKESFKVMAPTDPEEHLKIRVGIHVGDLSCGVLGQSVPKFSVFGDAVNLAARMEQTSMPMRIHVSKQFHDLIGEDETRWEESKITSVKNMGEVETWILDPVY